MKRKHLLFVGAIITIIALFGFGKTDAKADQEVVTEWYSEPHPEYFVFADCVEETSGGENATHYVYERYLWHDGKTWRATSKRLVPSDYTLNKYITSRDYGGVGKNTKKYNLWLSKEYDYPVQEESGGGYNVVSVTGEEFHAWSFYTVSSGSAPTQYRYRFSRTHNEYITNLNGYYRITTVPGKSFDVAGWGTESGTNLIIWDDIPPQANQTFLFSLQSDGSYIISDQNSGLCIDVDGDTVDGTNICMKTYNGGTSQRWYIGANSDGTYSLVSALFKVFVVDITWGADNENGSNVWLWLWHGGQNQRFYIEPVVVEPSLTYDRNAAVEFARKAYNTNYQMCTSLASCCLYVGGIPQKDDFAEVTTAAGSYGLKAKITGVKALYNYLINNDIAELIKPEFLSKYVIKYSDKIQPGDILMVKSNKGYHHNAVITAVDYDKDGNITIKFCQRAVARLDKKLYKTWAKNWNNNAEVYVLHIKDEDVSGIVQGKTDVEKIIEIAIGEIGYIEKSKNNNLDQKDSSNNDKTGASNWTKYARDYYKVLNQGICTPEWCSLFIWWCAYKAGLVDNGVFPKAGSEGLLLAKDFAQGFERVDNPQKGDIVYYNFGHVGLITDVDSSYIYTVEGNTGKGSGNGMGPYYHDFGDKVNDGSNVGAVVQQKKKKLTNAEIVGYYRPKYTSK